MGAPPRTYLDHNATSPLRPEAEAAVVQALQEGGNPSSVHAEGRRARARIEDARDVVATLAGVSPRGVIFTSGGTEANALALSPDIAFAGGRRPTRLLVSAIEHACVLEGHRFAAAHVERVPVRASGVIDLDALDTRVRALAAEGEVPLLALQAANNETGIVQPVRAAADIVHAVGGVLHCDAVQAAGKMDISLSEWGVDSAAFSAHKIGGPQGVGALALADSATALGARMLRGGGQERGARAGTENGPGIAGFGAALRVILSLREAEAARLQGLRDLLEQDIRLRAPEAIIVGEGEERLPNTTLFAVPGLPAATALIAFDLAGLAVSSGSACSSGKVTPSHVLGAMGAAQEITAGALRVSLGWNTSRDDVICFLEAFAKIRDVNRERRRHAA
jgi:cysteine desulfurase